MLFLAVILKINPKAERPSIYLDLKRRTLPLGGSQTRPGSVISVLATILFYLVRASKFS